MPVKMRWLIPGQVIYHYWWGTGTLDDVRYVNRRTIEMYQEYPNRHKIHTLSDSTDQTAVTNSLTDIRREYTSLDHPQTGKIIIVTNNSAIRIFGNLLLFMANSDFVLARSFEKSLKHLASVSPPVDLDEIDYEAVQNIKANVC